MKTQSMFRLPHKRPVPGRLWRCITIVAPLAALTSLCCSSPERDPAMGRQSPEANPEQALRRQAERLWDARQREDWSTVFELEGHLMTRQSVKEADFVEWCKTTEPFVYHSSRLGDVLTEGDRGWVEVNCRVSVRRFPKMDPKEVHRWEKWRRVQGSWYPVPREELELYPTSPAMRDTAAETHLLARFEESWDARQRRDWSHLSSLTDPQDEQVVSNEDFAKAHEQFEYIAHDVQWVEVIGDRGKVRFSFRHKLTDPSLTKVPPKDVVITEAWILLGDEWFLDLNPT